MAKKKKVEKIPFKRIVKNIEADKAREQIEIQAKPESLVGVYSNFTVVKHTQREFVTDFVWRIDNTNLLVSRIITSPQHAKAIHGALGQNIQNYEKAYGRIEED